MTECYSYESYGPSETSINIIRQIAYSRRVVASGNAMKTLYCIADA